MHLHLLLLFLNHKFFEFPVTHTKVWIVVAWLPLFLLDLRRHHVLAPVLTKLVARLILTGLLELRANLIEKLLIELVLFHILLMVVSLTGGQNWATML